MIIDLFPFGKNMLVIDNYELHGIMLKAIDANDTTTMRVLAKAMLEARRFSQRDDRRRGMT